MFENSPNKGKEMVVSDIIATFYEKHKGNHHVIEMLYVLHQS